MRLAARLVVLLLPLRCARLTVTGSAWATTNWLVHAATTNAGEAHANVLAVGSRVRHRRVRGAHHGSDGHRPAGLR